MDLLNVAFAASKAKKTKLWETQNTWYPEGELQLMVELTDAACKLNEIAIMNFKEDSFEHLDWYYDIAEPFGEFFVAFKHANPESIITEERMLTFLSAPEEEASILIAQADEEGMAA